MPLGFASVQGQDAWTSVRVKSFDVLKVGVNVAVLIESVVKPVSAAAPPVTYNASLFALVEPIASVPLHVDVAPVNVPVIVGAADMTKVLPVPV